MKNNKNNKDLFNLYVNNALSNIEAWNKKVKQKKFTINKGDTYPNKLLKIYRYANEHEDAVYLKQYDL